MFDWQKALKNKNTDEKTRILTDFNEYFQKFHSI